MKVSVSPTNQKPFERTEQALADFVDNGAVGLHWVAADGTILWANRSDYEFLGYSAEEYIGHSIAEFHVDARVVSDILERLAAGMTIVDCEAQLRSKDGSIRHVVITSSALFDEDGRFVHTRCFTWDITERRKLVEAARRSQEQLQFVTDAIPALISYVGADLRYRLVNSRYEDWFGHARDEILGRSLPEVLGEAAYESLRPHVETALLGEPVTFEAMVPYRDAGSRFVRAYYVPHRGPSGIIDGFVALVEDISKEKLLAAEREELLQREKDARAHLAFLANASAVLTASLDYNDTLKSVVDLMLPMLGDFGFFDVVEEEGQVRRIARAHDDPKRQALLDQTRWVRSERSDLNLCALSSGQSGHHPHVDDRWLRNVASSPAHLDLMRSLAFGSMITVPLLHGTKIRGALTLFFADSGRRHTDADVKLAEELARRAAAAVENASLFKGAQEAIAVRDDFLSVAGHELRTPLTALQLHLHSVVKMLTESGAGTSVRERAEKAAKSATRLSTLVDELLDISRVSAGRLTLNATSFDLVVAVGEVLEQTADDIARAGCTIDFKSEGDVIGSWDRDRIQQVVTNLLFNAIKYGKGKPVLITLARSGTEARLGVRDFGIGISVEDQHRIFERFERAVSSRHFGGLGLGLWIVRQIVECHRGTIRVESAPLQGAFFEVILPLAAAYP